MNNIWFVHTSLILAEITSAAPVCCIWHQLRGLESSEDVVNHSWHWYWLSAGFSAGVRGSTCINAHATFSCSSLTAWWLGSAWWLCSQWEPDGSNVNISDQVWNTCIDLYTAFYSLEVSKNNVDPYLRGGSVAPFHKKIITLHDEGN